MKSIRRKRYLLFAAFLAFIVLLMVITQIPWRRLTGNPVVISRDTTRLIAPRAADGTIDYIKYLNDRSSEGVTPENNITIELASVMDDDAWLNIFPATVAEEMLGAKIPTTGPVICTLAEFLYSSGHWSANQVLARDPDEDFRAASGPWTRDQLPQCYEWMKSSEAGLNRIVAATRMTRYYNPLIAPEDPALLGACSLPMAENLSVISQALIVRSTLR